MWYYDVGSVMVIILLLNCFFRNFIDLSFFARKLYNQASDRGFKKNLNRNPEDPDDDEPNTKKLVQEDL